MTKEEILLLNDQIRKDFPNVNCFIHCSILSANLDDTNDLYYDGDDVVCRVGVFNKKTRGFEFLTIGNLGLIENPNQYLREISDIPYEQIKKLAQAGLGIEQERVSTAIKGNELYAFTQTNT